MKVLVFGANGQVGHELAHGFGDAVECVALDRRQVDFSIPGQAGKAVETHAPDVVINAAAYTSVDKAETEPSRAMMINAITPGELAAACDRRGAWCIHYSTDYVFDGTATRPYTEEDPVSPLGIYGKTKLEGERLIQQQSGKYLILRTSWVYSWRGANFVKTMLRLAGEREELNVVNDQLGCPSYAPDIAAATAAIVKSLEEWHGIGIYHLSGSEPASWYDFAKAIFNKSGDAVKVIPVPSSEYPTPAKRPAYSILDNRRIRQQFGISLPGFSESLDNCIRRIAIGR